MKFFITAAITVSIFSSATVNAQAKKTVHSKPTPLHSKSIGQEQVATQSSTVMPPVAPLEKRVDAFMKKNSEIKSFFWEPGLELTIEKKDGTKENYKMDYYEVEKSVVAKYGVVPLTPAIRNRQNVMSTN